MNTAHPTLNLKQGSVSKSILEKGGNSIATECKEKYPMGIEIGQIAKSGAGNLPFCNIYHGTLMLLNGKNNNDNLSLLRVSRPKLVHLIL